MRISLGAVVFLISSSMAISPSLAGTTIAGLTSDSGGADAILLFDAAVPQNVLSFAPITGLAAGETVVAIDARPLNGKLYALTTQAAFTVPRLRTIDPTTGASTLVGILAADPADSTSPFAALAGTHFAIDFNPVADRLRIVSDSGQNLRVGPDANVGGNCLVITDTNLSFAAGDSHAGATPAVFAIAYSSNNAGAISTRLFGIDDVNLTTVEQTPPNNGTLNSLADFGLENATHPGFDIAPDGTGFVAGRHAVPGEPLEWILAELDPVTAAGESHGLIGDGSLPIRDIAVVTSVSFSRSLFASFETAGSATITVTRDGFSNTMQSVAYTTVSQTASAGSDYLTASGTLVFAPTEGTKSFTVPVNNDALPEPDEFVGLVLSSPGATPGTNAAPVIGAPGAVARLRINSSDRLDKVGPHIVFIGLTGPSRAIDGAVIRFDEDMDPATVTNLANYRLTAVTRTGALVSKQFSAASYDPVEREVTLGLTGFAQTKFVRLAVRVTGHGPHGVRDVNLNRLDGNRDRRPGGDAVQAFRVFSSTTLRFSDRDGDRVKFNLAGGGHLDGVLPLGGPRTQHTQFWIVDPVSLSTTLTGTVAKGNLGDGTLVVSEIIGLDKVEISRLLVNRSFQVNRLTFSSSATGR